MTPTVHLLLLPLLLSVASAQGLNNKKGPLVNTSLDVPEQTAVPYAIYQFQVSHPDVTGFQLTGEGHEDIKIAEDGWLYLDRPLDWATNSLYVIEPIYTAVVRERSPSGVPLLRVSAKDLDDPETPNGELRYSVVSQIPDRINTLFFQIDPVTGQISTTQEGETMLKAKESLQYSRGEDFSSPNLKKKFDDYCTPNQEIPYELNPFYSCVERAEIRKRNMDPMGDPDYILMVRVEDLAGASENALSSITRVQIVVEQNLWVNPGPITVKEQGEGPYPMVIAEVQANEANATYRLVQKERALRFPFSITPEGDVLLNEELDREEKDMYILVVLAEDEHGNEMESPMEIQVVVEDINDNVPQCESEESVFEIQENEPVGSHVGQLLAHDSDEVVIKVIDVNNELPLFERNNYGSLSIAEDTPVGEAVLTVRASDADDPGSGSSLIVFNISSGNHGDAFAVETDGHGEGKLVIVKPLDFEAFPTYTLKIDARNPEPLMKGLDYDDKSSASVFISVTDVDEDPQFSSDVLTLSVPEDLPIGEVLFHAEAKDPEGEEIGFKMDGDVNGWLVIDEATGEIKSEAKLDRETLEVLELTITAFEKAKPEKYADRVLTVRLTDVNDNHPTLTETQAFICSKSPKPVVLRAVDIDSAPFSEPFTFSFPQGKKSPNWELTAIDGTSAQLKMKKSPSEDKIFSIPISITDNAGMGVTQKIEVIAFAIVVHRIKKSNEEKKKEALEANGDTDGML
ncbi:hypothetical protein CRUP_034935 [Coryphaenoides rupestris]|nr:hypothetical protein CRUP_034935 [Coryphaenoides rupestris]